VVTCLCINAVQNFYKTCVGVGAMPLADQNLVFPVYVLTPAQRSGEKNQQRLFHLNQHFHSLVHIWKDNGIF